MKGVILAAGKGTRLAPFTKDMNKCLIPVENKPLIVHHIEHLAQTKCIHECVIVVGYKADEVIKQIGHCVNGIKIIYCYQLEAKERGIISSVECAIDCIQDDFFLLLGDEFIYQNNYKRAIRKFYEERAQCMVGIIETDDSNYIKKNYTFQIQEGGNLSNFIEKPERPFNSYIGTGNIIFRREVCELLKDVPMNEVRMERELVDLFEIMIRQGERIYPFAVGEEYFNVNTVKELLRVRQFLQMKKKQEVIHEH